MYAAKVSNCCRNLARRSGKCYARRYTHIASSVKETTADEGTDASSFKVGDKLHGFEVKSVDSVPEFKLSAIKLLHERTRAEYLHLYRDDSNNVFAVQFRTTPLDSTGLPHILEHTVLCGSKLFPVRDPFFKMLNRSLATFMNALTGSDYTMYPFSTLNHTDFRNLQKIYLDAVFRPNLRRLDFMQEGWRLENVDLKNQQSDLIIKGIVYNEMKGVFSENENIFAQKIQNAILPDHTYGVISGGDPSKIPNLTWEDLKEFHRKCYHPSNARFYSYGNFPITPSLEYINREYLSQYDYLEPKHTKVPNQKRWAIPHRDHISGRFEKLKEPIEKQNTIAISLMMSDVTDTFDTFVLQFVTELLISGPNSPFYKALIEPNFSGGFIPSTGFDIQSLDTIFTIGLQGLDKEKFDEVVKIFDKTINDVVLNGFESKQIESVLHRYELGIKHEASNFGLRMLFNLAPIWNHDGDVVAALKANTFLDKLKEKLKDPKYLQSIVEIYFANNNHRLVLTMSPDVDYEKKLEKDEKKVIDSKTKNLSYDERTKIFKDCQELLQEQSTPQKVALLPSLQIDDINSDVERVPTKKEKFGNVPTHVFTVNTNGITYFRGILNTSDLSPEQHMLLPLFSYVITKLGTDRMDYRQFDTEVNLKTAGLNFSVFVGESLHKLHTYEPGLMIESYALDQNVPEMWKLWDQIFKISQLKDVQRFEMLFKLYMSNLTHGIADAGHSYAMSAASGLVSGTGYQKELMSGLQHIAYMKRLVKTSSYKAMLDEIMNIARVLFDKNKLRCSLNITEENKQHTLDSFAKFIQNLPASKVPSSSASTFTTAKVFNMVDTAQCQHHVLNIPVHYCAKSVITVPYVNPEFAKLRVLARLLTSKYLHLELREKQGAYGGGAHISPDGCFNFYSYRDPRHLQTLDVFDNSHEWLQTELGNVTKQDLLEAKLGVFQKVDAPLPPNSKGMTEFLRGLTPDILQRHRSEIMAVNLDGIKEVSEKYLSKQSAVSVGKVILGSKSPDLDTSPRLYEIWTVVDVEE